MVLPQLGSWTYTGFMATAMNGVDIAWVIGLVVASVVYLILSRSLDPAAERAAVLTSNEQLADVDAGRVR